MTTRQATSGHAELDLLIEASLAAGRVALTYFRNDVEISWKNGGTSPVTAADHAANDILKRMLLDARPGYGWLSEETEDTPARLSRDHVFIVDPIDGTRAFMNGRETWVVSAGLTEHGIPVAGVLYAPALDELYVATSVGQVEKNGTTLRVAGPDDGGRLRISAADDMINRLDTATRARIDRVGNIPSLAYRLAMIADGRLDATIVKPNAHDWDLVAADLILRNAGGRLTDLDGNDLVYNGASPRHGILVAASGHAHEAVIGALAS